LRVLTIGSTFLKISRSFGFANQSSERKLHLEWTGKLKVKFY